MIYVYVITWEGCDNPLAFKERAEAKKRLKKVLEEPELFPEAKMEQYILRKEHERRSVLIRKSANSKARAKAQGFQELSEDEKRSNLDRNLMMAGIRI